MNTTCPYCNSNVPLSSEPIQNRRVTCPRCAESFPISLDAPPVNGDSTTLPSTVSTPSSQSRRGVNRRLGMGILGFMLLLAAGIAAILTTTRSDRRLTNLGEMPALGYLPSDSNVIAAANFVEADATKDGRETLDRLGLGAGPNLDKIVGLNRDQIEDAAVGLNVTHELIPRIVIVVRTRQPYDFDTLRTRLGAKGTKKTADNREYDLIQPPGLPLEFALWRPSPQTLVYCHPETDLAKIPAEPTAEANRFAQPLAELLKFRTERGTFLWLVAHSDDWDKAGPLKLLAKFDPKTLAELRSVGIGVRYDTGAQAKRVRTARITEDVDPTARGIALDMVIEAEPGTQMKPLEDALTDWTQKHDLMLHDEERKDTRFSGTITAQPDQWGRAFQALKRVEKK